MPRAGADQWRVPSFQVSSSRRCLDPLLHGVGRPNVTPPYTNIEPENGPVEDYFPLQPSSLGVPCGPLHIPILRRYLDHLGPSWHLHNSVSNHLLTRLRLDPYRDSTGLQYNMPYNAIHWPLKPAPCPDHPDLIQLRPGPRKIGSTSFCDSHCANLISGTVPPTCVRSYHRSYQQFHVGVLNGG